MRLSCLQENLARGLSVVGRAVATRTTLPITQHVLMSSDGGRLKLSATNLEIAISTWVGAQVDEEGSVTIPARLLTDFVTSLPREAMPLGEEKKLTTRSLEALTSGQIEFRLVKRRRREE